MNSLLSHFFREPWAWGRSSTFTYGPGSFDLGLTRETVAPKELLSATNKLIVSSRFFHKHFICFYEISTQYYTLAGINTSIHIFIVLKVINSLIKLLS